MENLIGFAAGACYGFTSVAVGQPLDTIKTRMQAIPSLSQFSSWSVGKDLYTREGIRGLYRGGLPPFIGGSLFRSAQFGFYEVTLRLVRQELPSYKIGQFDYQILIAGIAGGIGRGFVEGPFDYVKVRLQVEKPWSLQGLYQGTGATMTRNCFLFSSFALYMDLLSPLTNYVAKYTTKEVGAFVKGAICADLAWLTIWPLDVVKSQLQSGNYSNKGYLYLLKTAHKERKLYRGIVPGLIRSTFANGCSMVVYEKVHKFLTKQFK